MSESRSDRDLTRLLVSSREDASSHEELVRCIVPDLKEIAHRALRRRPEANLQTTELVSEAWMKLFAGSGGSWRDRIHFFAIAARAMREILVDKARERLAQKRGGDWKRVTLGSLESGGAIAFDLIDLDEVLSMLSETFPQEASIVELRFFGGLDFPEISEALGVSLSTVKREWRFARAWLASRLDER